MSDDTGNTNTTTRPAAAQAERIVGGWEAGRGSLIGLLQAIQAECNHLPPPSLDMVAQRLDLPLSQVHSVATFYSSFSLEPRGEHVVTCCLGTACHVRGGDRIVRELSGLLDIEPGETTPDRLFTLETVRCLGACALAPLVVIDGTYHAKMTPRKARKIVERLWAQERQS